MVIVQMAVLMVTMTTHALYHVRMGVINVIVFLVHVPVMLASTELTVLLIVHTHVRNQTAKLCVTGIPDTVHWVVR